MRDLLAAEIERLEGELTVLRELQAEAVALEERVQVALNGSDPAPRAEPPKAKPPARRKPAKPRAPANGTPSGTNADRVLAALQKGPATSGELIERAQVPRGSMPYVLADLARSGRIVKPTARGGTYSLAGSNGPSLEPDDDLGKSHMTPTLIGQVLEVVAHKSMGTNGIAAELGEPITAVTDALEELEDKGDVAFNGMVWEPSP